jgi:hypothetical protein
MKATQVFPIVIFISIVSILTGTISKQPLLRGLGEIALLGAISRRILVKQQQLDIQSQKQLTLLIKENTSLQTKLSDTEYELNKLDQKVRVQNTCQRLYLSKIDKLQHQQKIIAGNLTQLQHKLDHQTASKFENNRQISQALSVTSLWRSETEFLSRRSLNFDTHHLFLTHNFSTRVNFIPMLFPNFQHNF